MDRSLPFTPDEVKLISDAEFFRAKARIMKKVRGMLEEVYTGLLEDVKMVELSAPGGFDPRKFQFVKGEHLDDFPYQYLDFPKHFEGDNKFTFRSLFWWGHHFIFAFILEGEGLLRYKQNLVNRYHLVAGRDLYLSLGPSPWEWKKGEGYTLPVSHDHKSQVSAVLSGRRFFKLTRFVPYDHPSISDGCLAEVGRETFRSMLPVITP
jgi:hypothetical protein